MNTLTSFNPSFNPSPKKILSWQDVKREEGFYELVNPIENYENLIFLSVKDLEHKNQVVIAFDPLVTYIAVDYSWENSSFVKVNNVSMGFNFD